MPTDRRSHDPVQRRLDLDAVRADGRVVVSSFLAEARTVSWWSNWIGLMAACGVDVAFVPTFINYTANINSFDPINHEVSVWGGRTTARTAHRARSHLRLPLCAAVRSEADRWTDEAHESAFRAQSCTRPSRGAHLPPPARRGGRGHRTQPVHLQGTRTRPCPVVPAGGRHGLSAGDGCRWPSHGSRLAPRRDEPARRPRSPIPLREFRVMFR